MFLFGCDNVTISNNNNEVYMIVLLDIILGCSEFEHRIPSRGALSCIL